MLIIDDDTKVYVPPGYSTGLIPTEFYYGDTPDCIVEADIQTYPMEEWPDRIARQKRDKASALDVWRDSPIGVLDQNGLPYCHAFSPTVLGMILRYRAGLPYVELSAGSVGGPVTNYRKRGAWIIDDLEQISEHGIATTEYVPMMQVSKNGWKSGATENALLHRVTEWDKLERNNFEQQGSALLSGQGVCVGQNYWSHAVTQLELVDLNNGKKATDHNRYAIDFLNSWGKKYGEGGIGRQVGSKKFADEQYVPRRIRSSEE